MILPFTRSEFLEVFAAYNSAVWPYPVVAAFLGALAIVLLFWRPPRRDRAISTILFVFWSTMAVGYHGLFFPQSMTRPTCSPLCSFWRH